MRRHSKERDMSMYVAIPCMDQIPTEFFKNILTLKTPPHSAYGITVSTLIYDARNTLAQAAIDSECDRVMWIDSDMTFEPDIIERLSADIDEGRDFVSALYFTRKNPIKPVIFDTVGYKELPDGMKESYAGFYVSYPRNEIFEVKAAGFGVAMTTTKLLKDVFQHYGAPFTPIPGLGEDISFCRHCEELGYKIYCDSRIKAGHIGNLVITEQEFDEGLTLK